VQYHVSHSQGRTTVRSRTVRKQAFMNPGQEIHNVSRLRWGVLGVARIATAKVIPAMKQSERSEVTAIASRDLQRAIDASRALAIPKAYGSYEELLADPEIDAVYNPLPNHLHVQWTIRAAEAGKHVLCEKPIALTVAEARRLIDVRDRTGVQIQEAFMVRTHPQWIEARELVRNGRIGTLRSMLGHFSYFNDDPANIRNVPEFGGGGLMDIGCYLINTSRFIFEGEPRRVSGLIDRDPVLGIDRMASMLLDFGTGHLAGTCSTQMVAFQRMQILGTSGRIEIEIPFNAPPDRPCRIVVDSGADPFGGGADTIEMSVCDQYTIQADLFSAAVLAGRPVPSPLEDAVANMACIEAVFRSAESGRWEAPVSADL
jgi:predicted dehydrogenase